MLRMSRDFADMLFSRCLFDMGSRSDEIPRSSRAVSSRLPVDRAIVLKVYVLGKVFVRKDGILLASKMVTCAFDVLLALRKAKFDQNVPQNVHFAFFSA